MKLIYVLGSPCQSFCTHSDIKKTYKVVTTVEEIPEGDKRNYSYCKWCEIFLRFPYAKRFCQCPCCSRTTRKVMTHNGSGKWYDDY